MSGPPLKVPRQLSIYRVTANRRLRKPEKRPFTILAAMGGKRTLFCQPSPSKKGDGTRQTPRKGRGRDQVGLGFGAARTVYAKPYQATDYDSRSQNEHYEGHNSKGVACYVRQAKAQDR